MGICRFINFMFFTIQITIIQNYKNKDCTKFVLDLNCNWLSRYVIMQEYREYMQKRLA